MNSKLFIRSAAFALLVFTGCTKNFDTLNENPNSPQQVKNEQFLLPAIIITSVRNYSYQAQFGGSVVSDYYANQYTSGFDDHWTASQTEGGFLWNFFNQLKDVENLRVLSHEKGDKNNEGVSLVLWSWMFQVMTDNFGDMPYSEAVQGKIAGNFAPVYTKQEDIYYSLMDSLKVANTLLSTGTDPINSDILMGGSAMRWREFANGLRLRLLLRMSGVTGAKIDVGTEMNNIVSDPATYPLFASNNDQAALEFTDELNNEFPAYHNPPIGDYHLSTTFETNLKDLNDPRIAFFAMPTPASYGTGSPLYAGVPNCIGTSESTYNGGSNNQSQESPILMPYLGYPNYASKTAAQGLLLTYSEVQFILAEAKERGLISAGDDAATYYMNGITAQFAYDESRLDVLNQGIPSSDHNFAKSSDIIPDPSYFTQPGVAYTGTTDEKLYKIRIQKWFSLFYNGFEGWSEWRRTGVPKETQIGPSSAISAWPRRTRYPLSEQTVNTANYNAALQAQGPDDLLTKVWWNK
ncbi:MAG: SusD/RagB family nutrient-binding outer membrane lipoprotein [Bacteroidota bacterium]|nr:SusD/RagB family nutrient-binding outer membrane lipoprotein [Bacteroidota bacterium]